jgi:hypothetical protein
MVELKLESAATILRNLEQLLNETRDGLADDQQFDVVALLVSGERIRVRSIRPAGDSAVIIAGHCSNGLSCRAFVPCSQLQIFLQIETDPVPRALPQIGFLSVDSIHPETPA